MAAKKSAFKDYIPLLLLMAVVGIVLMESEWAGERARKEAKTFVPKTFTGQKDSVQKKDTIIKKIYERKFNDIARYISGLPQDSGTTLDSTLLQDAAWKNFSEDFSANWKKYDSTRLTALRDFSSKELADMDSGNYTMFYPFSGPDILHANIFFPDAETTVMIGLEPVGSVPALNQLKDDSLSRYLNSIDKSLYAILKFSFFRTIAMKVDLRKELDGTVPLMMIFLERTGNEILDVKHLYVNKEGKLLYDTTAKQGVEILFRKKESEREQKVIYFSVDISNGGFENSTPEFLTYLKSLGEFRTYLKSASFLMHNDYFSTIRELIISQSSFVFQDDSGVPLRFFADDVWDKFFFGTYTGTIPMFSKSYQKELADAYKDSTRVKPLNFGIGYKWKQGTSNLMLFKKKPAVKSVY